MASLIGTTFGQNSRRKLMKQIQRDEKFAPRVADLAPEFTLKSLEGETETSLAELRKQKPVVLIFGSYT